MSDYRDPKVTKADDKKGSNVGKWLGYAAAVILALLLLSWLLGWFADDETEVEMIDPAVTEEPGAIEQPDPVVEPDVVE